MGLLNELLSGNNACSGRSARGDGSFLVCDLPELSGSQVSLFGIVVEVATWPKPQ